jgi:DNA-3-methyladenine glycosylase I
VDRLKRCAWAGTDPLMVRYHDREWGVPLHNDRRLFEMLTLEGAQAGLSWSTILRKRQHYRRAFLEFDPAAVARMDLRARRRLMSNAGIVRNRLKIEATVANARALLTVQASFGSFDRFLWGFFRAVPRQHRWTSISELPVQTPESLALSRELKRRGFRFVGPTICYAFMQAIGIVNDHTADCFRHAEIARR